jgi:hypothetical protein
VALVGGVMADQRRHSSVVVLPLPAVVTTSPVGVCLSSAVTSGDIPLAQPSWSDDEREAGEEAAADGARRRRRRAQ